MCTCFFFNDTATTEIYTLSLHDALPISPFLKIASFAARAASRALAAKYTFSNTFFASDGFSSKNVVRPSFKKTHPMQRKDRKSTRLNSSHQIISYAVFCLKKT